jgi:hypothetical protein
MVEQANRPPSRNLLAKDSILLPPPLPRLESLSESLQRQARRLGSQTLLARCNRYIRTCYSFLKLALVVRSILLCIKNHFDRHRVGGYTIHFLAVVRVVFGQEKMNFYDAVLRAPGSTFGTADKNKVCLFIIFEIVN